MIGFQIANGPVESLLWDAPTAAKALGISERTLWSLTFDVKTPDEKRVPHLRIGYRVLYDPGDLKAWIKRNKVNGDSDTSRVQ